MSFERKRFLKIHIYKVISLYIYIYTLFLPKRVFLRIEMRHLSEYPVKVGMADGGISRIAEREEREIWFQHSLSVKQKRGPR